MKKKYIHFEVVPVEVAEKVLKQQSFPAKRKGKRKPAVRKSGKTVNRLHAVPKKAEAFVP